jgi:hypothetical protein
MKPEAPDPLPGEITVPTGSTVKSVILEATITRADGSVEPQGVISSGERCEACGDWIAGQATHECPKRGPIARAFHSFTSFLRRLV